jgi:hypothetical protein
MQIVGDETDSENEEMSHEEPLVMERDFYQNLIKQLIN